MFRFAAQEFLLTLFFVPLAATFVWYAVAARRTALKKLGNPQILARLTESLNMTGRKIRIALLFPTLGFLALALARPQFGTRMETVQREGQDIVVAIDVSASMLAEDITPNRLERAKFAVNTLINRLQGDRVAIVAFAGDAFVQTPLTIDYAAATMFLTSMSPEIIPVPGTNLAKALDVSLDAFAADVEQHRVLILITDGEDHEGDFQERIDRARNEGVTIFAVGMGSTDGVPIPAFDRNGRRTGFRRDRAGNVVTTRLDEATLRNIAEGTGGRYLRAATGRDLDQLADEISEMDGRQFEARQVTQFKEQYQIFLGLALFMLIAETFIPERRSRTHQWTGRFS